MKDGAAGHKHKDGGDEKCVQNFSRETSRLLGNQVMDEKLNNLINTGLGEAVWIG
jgi:hypothetical protein